MQVSTPNGGTLNLRATASSSATILERIPNGTELQVISSNNGWSQVTYNGKEGYVQSSFLVNKTDISKAELQKIYDSLKNTLTTIENILK